MQTYELSPEVKHQNLAAIHSATRHGVEFYSISPRMFVRFVVGIVNLPHVDQVLSKSDWFCVSGNGDCAIRVAAGLAVLAVWYADHGAAELSEILEGSHFMHSKIICFSKWANPGLFFVNFGLFKQTIKFLHHNQCEKMSCPSSIRRRASNPRPLEHEPSPARLALYVCSFQTFVIIDIIDKKVWLSLGIEPGAAAMPLRFDCQRSFYGLVYKQ